MLQSTTPSKIQEATIPSIYELEVQYRLANRTDEKNFKDLIVLAADFILKSENGKEYEPIFSSSNVTSHQQNGKFIEGFVTFYGDEVDTYVLGFSSDAYTDQPQKFHIGSSCNNRENHFFIICRPPFRIR